MKSPWIIACLATSLLVAAEPDGARDPHLLHLGALTLRPFGFLDAIGMSRNSTTADSVSTRFGRIPLTNGNAETLGSLRHSRLMLKGDLPAGPLRFSAYLESDFMNVTPGQTPYHWRQYWGQARLGKWEILGGQAWSLLRPNRTGTASDIGTMNTDVVDPAYHVGLIGSRIRQIRLTRMLGSYQAALAWEDGGNLAAKLVHDNHRAHLELAAFNGRFGRRGAAISGGLNLSARFRVVSQQYWSKRAAYQALGVVPAGINGLSTLNGVEVQAHKGMELYSYGGLVYAARTIAFDNRVVRQWSSGLNQRIALPGLHSGILMSVEYSHLDRAVWSGRAGAMDFAMYRVRYIFN